LPDDYAVRVGTARVATSQLIDNTCGLLLPLRLSKQMLEARDAGFYALTAIVKAGIALEHVVSP
jgi:hypothetical protein